MNNTRIYNELILRAKLRVKPEGYFEKHHVIPRSLGGSDSKDNLVNLTAREHFISHCLLARIHGGTQWYSVLRMKNDNKYFNSKLYEHAKEKWGKVASELRTGNKHPFYGKKQSAEHSSKISESLKGKKRPDVSEKNKQKAGKKNLGVSERNKTRLGEKRPEHAIRMKIIMTEYWKNKRLEAGKQIEL